VLRYVESLAGRQQVSTVKAKFYTTWTLTTVETRNERSMGEFVIGKALLAVAALLEVPAHLLGQCLPIESKP